MYATEESDDVFFFPLGVLSILPAASNNGQRPIRGPARKLRPGVCFIYEFLPDASSICSIPANDHGPHGPYIRMPTAWKICLKLGVTDQRGDSELIGIGLSEAEQYHTDQLAPAAATTHRAFAPFDFNQASTISNCR